VLIVGDNLDRIASLEMRRQEEPYRGVNPVIYDLIRGDQGEPSSTLAARTILDATPAGGTVMMITGAGFAPWMPKGEVDGPPGLSALARTLWHGRGLISVFVVAENHVDIVEATLLGLGLNPLPWDMAQSRYWPAATIEVMPYGKADPEWVAGLFDRYEPRVVVSSEKLGPNDRGVIHSGTGVAWPLDVEVEAAALIEGAARRGIPSIGIGDGGNEIGYGKFKPRLDNLYGDRRRSQCGCGGTIFTSVATDVVIHAGNSDWGAYSVAAAASFLLGDVSLMVSKVDLGKALEACVAAGGVGQHGRRVDLAGSGLEAQLAINTLMHEVVDIALRHRPNRPY
jgi:D-glutamate cyclase